MTICSSYLLKSIAKIYALWAWWDEILGLGKVWSHIFRSPSCPQEANTFSDVGCHLTSLQFFMWPGIVNSIFPLSQFPTWMAPPWQPVINKGFFIAHYTALTSPWTLATHALPFPISQKLTSPFPHPINKNLSFNSNQEILKTASYITP